MKLKKIVTSKPFIAGTLTVLCLGIVVACLTLQGNEKSEFVPESSSKPTPAESWSENPSTSEPENGSGMNGGTGTSSKEEYPKVVENDESRTVVDFTNPTPEKPEAPPAPEGKTEIVTSSSHPVQKDPSVTPPKQESKTESQKSGTPAPGSKNDKGQVYDPVFGWITVPDGKSVPADNDGDINKQVGTMGD
ncbi:DUF6550 family protein [Caproicibacter sp. BJN0012]|uniref:DUF6550 family protein n=1 Tax=Caproicibacter sp. BJN0012 TaxID=3110227 RepID=UPI002E0FC3A2